MGLNKSQRHRWRYTNKCAITPLGEEHLFRCVYCFTEMWATHRDELKAAEEGCLRVELKEGPPYFNRPDTIATETCPKGHLLRWVNIWEEWWKQCIGLDINHKPHKWAYATTW